ncbi:MAG: hypothetical protein P0S95_02145 [Rhabdochlamydiaceae bacterium]|nr:hypothetical protein [Candidatus Amphrikana amoebophyrae]
MVGVEQTCLHIENNKQPSSRSHDNWAHNPNYEKSTHKAMYGSEGNSQGSATFLNGQQINALIKSSGISPKGQPFQLFFFFIKEVFMNNDIPVTEKNIDKFAKQLETMSDYSNAWENIKNMVFQNDKGTVNQKAFVGAVGAFINKLCSKLGVSFPTNGSWLSKYQFTQLIKKVTAMTPAQQVDAFPLLGQNALSVLNSLNSFVSYFSIGPYSRPQTLSALWNNVNNGGPAMPNGSHMPNPHAFSSFFDALSEGSSILSGVSQSNSSKLSYAQNQYNRLNAFVHVMLSDWQNIRKGMNVKMAQARN